MVNEACGLPDGGTPGLFETDPRGRDERLVFQTNDAAPERGKQLRMSLASQHQADSFPRVLDFN